MYKAHFDKITRTVAILNKDNYPLLSKTLPVPCAVDRDPLAIEKNAQVWASICELVEQANKGKGN